MLTITINNKSSIVSHCVLLVLVTQSLQQCCQLHNTVNIIGSVEPRPSTEWLAYHCQCNERAVAWSGIEREDSLCQCCAIAMPMLW